MGQEVISTSSRGTPTSRSSPAVSTTRSRCPPYDLPANKTQTGIKSRSSKERRGQLQRDPYGRQEGSEQLFIHAEKNQDIEVENDETHWAGTTGRRPSTTTKRRTSNTIAPRPSITTRRSRLVWIGPRAWARTKPIAIGANRHEDVGANETVTIGREPGHDGGGERDLTVALQRTHSVGINETIPLARRRRSQ